MSQFHNSGSHRVILIDDDRSFGHIMKRCAEQKGVDLDHFESLADLGYVALVGRYDVAILDYDLGNMTGIEISDCLTALFDHMPMLLISGSMRLPGPAETSTGIVRPFIQKSRGYELILETALALCKAPTSEARAGLGPIGLGAM